MNSRTINLMKSYALMGLMTQDGYKDKSINREEVTEEDLERFEEIRKQKQLEIKKKNGLKEFNIDGKKVFAINMKNAIRKAKKLTI